MGKNFNFNFIWSVISQFANYGISIIFTIILARLILPGDYGIIDQANTVIAFFIIFADGGFVWSIVKEKELNFDKLINISWINILIGIFLFIIIYITAPIIAEFYNNEILINVLRILGLIFIVTAINTPFLMWLKRNMEFKKIAFINILSGLSGGSLGVLAAHYNLGYWSLVILSFSKSLIQMFLSIVFSKMPFGFYKFNVPIKDFLYFGVGLIGFGIVNYFARNLDNVIIGKFEGAKSLAFYSKAYFLMFLPSMLITGGLAGLMISVLSKVEYNLSKFKLVYLKVYRLIFILTFPVTGFFFFFPKEPILFFYGHNWLGSVILLQILSVAAVTQPLYNTMGWIYTALGKSKMMFHWGIISSIMLMISFFAGIKWGVCGVAFSYSFIMGIVLFVLGLKRAFKLFDLSFLESIKFIMPVIISGVISLTIVKVLFTVYYINGFYLSLFLKVTVLLSIYFLLLFLIYKNKFIELFLIKGI